MRVMRKQCMGPGQTQTCGSIKVKGWTEALQSVDYKWRMGKEAGSTSIKLPDTSPAIISEHSINRNTEVDLASRVPLTALITGALAQALRMVLHAPAELATQCGAKFSMRNEPAGVYNIKRT